MEITTAKEIFQGTEGSLFGRVKAYYSYHWKVGKKDLREGGCSFTAIKDAAAAELTVEKKAQREVDNKQWLHSWMGKLCIAATTSAVAIQFTGGNWVMWLAYTAAILTLNMLFKTKGDVMNKSNKSILSYKKSIVYLVLMVLAVVLTGCGNSPEERDRKYLEKVVQEAAQEAYDEKFTDTRTDQEKVLAELETKVYYADKDYKTCAYTVTQTHKESSWYQEDVRALEVAIITLNFEIDNYNAGLRSFGLPPTTEYTKVEKS